ncbi:hypothetical protein [Intestinibacter sp.]|uniref:hypothetical protein n=1 Tax=Intestinibacter sp. TaxID=1965304 RepID=UPI003F18E353
MIPALANGTKELIPSNLVPFLLEVTGISTNKQLPPSGVLTFTCLDVKYSFLIVFLLTPFNTSCSLSNEKS